MGKRKTVPKEITDMAKSLAEIVHKMDVEKATEDKTQKEFSKKG